MPRLTAMALILETADWGDSSRRLVAFAREEGRVAAIARGARKPTRGAYTLAGAEPFTSGMMSWSRRSDEAMGTLIEFAPALPRAALRADLDAYAVGAHALELLDRLPTIAEHGSEALYDGAASFLDAVDETAADAVRAGTAAAAAGRDVRRALLLELLATYLLAQFRLAGHDPEWNRCVVTHRPLGDAEESGFSVSLGGRVSLAGQEELGARRRAEGHAAHRTLDVRALSASTLAAMAAWRRGLPANATSPAALERALNLLVSFARHHLDVPLRSYAFLQSRFFGRGEPVVGSTSEGAGRAGAGGVGLEGVDDMEDVDRAGGEDPGDRGA